MYGLSDEFICDYIAAEDSLIASYKYESPEDYKAIFREQPKYCYAFLQAAIRQYRLIYEKYKSLEDSAKIISDFIAKQYSDYESPYLFHFQRYFQLSFEMNRHHSQISI